ncbi:hypothetical protein ACFFX1_49310 [Dactylosporangium sucinum]|uniref:Uncharacterized protein n=1 Tax=Dactylosporangium sucinum TaxID=1424081 RepID=A0A917X8E2_9ACTN|nr:hypothetical protein [Dactylosporangium sucinum]GGM90016.1 hypothetical protein GCM10007977_110080 [Dactylosporangium sucinum]
MARHPTRNFRPNPRYYDPVEAAAAAGVSMNVLLQAMLREFLAAPAARLAALAPHLQAVAAETPRRGRPSTADAAVPVASARSDED